MKEQALKEGALNRVAELDAAIAMLKKMLWDLFK
jgi:hypothetical protein